MTIVHRPSFPWLPWHLPFLQYPHPPLLNIITIAQRTIIMASPPPPTSPTDNPTPPIHGPIKRDVLFTNLPPFPLPFYKYVSLPQTPAGMVAVAPPNPQENCVGRSVFGAIAGAGLGVMMGIFLGAMGDMSPAIPIINGREAPQAPAGEQMRLAYRATFERCGHWARNFMALTALFSGVDCVVEKLRGKHDAYNAVISGCGVGAALSAKQGPQAACLGCAGFAIFSGIMEVVMGPH